MSRSRRAPIWVDGYGSKVKRITKRAASRAVRSANEVANGKDYKKQFNSWNIADFKFYDPKSKKVRRK